MLWIKSLHIVFVASWFAGLFYLPRLFVNHAMVSDKATLERRYGELPMIECLPSELNQVYMNMLLNAGHAIGERGNITVSTGAVGDEVWIEFKDNGSGISPELRQRIFDPFFTTKPVGDGSGLGLSLSYGIVKKHRGDISVSSEVGKGTKFRVVLPIRQTAA